MNRPIGLRRSQVGPMVGAVVLALLAAGCGGTPDLQKVAAASTTTAPQRTAPSEQGRPCTAVNGATDTIKVADQPVTVHLPACYASSGVRYPVIYLVHGAGADQTQWLDVGAATASDELTHTGATKPVILVMPDVDRLSGAQADRYLADRLLPSIDAHYRTIADAAHRAVGGISRGGGTALRVAAARPDLFSVVGGHSPATGVVSKELIRGLRPYSGKIWLDVGTDDNLAGATRSLNKQLHAAGIEDHLELNPGGHDRPYWRNHTPDYLTFYGTHLHG